MKTSMQLNALIRNLSAELNVESEIILRNYMLERLLERVALSEYSENFILKGGLLIASMVGLGTRSTMDMDATILGQSLTESQTKSIFLEIINIEIDDNVTFVFRKIEEIREGTEYPGYRISFDARLDQTRQVLKIDITTGDVITPREIDYQYKLMFEDRTIRVLAFNLETVLSEKLEGILVRGITNTRMRDFYDLYILTAVKGDSIDRNVLAKALKNTADKRGSSFVLENINEIVETIEVNTAMSKLWGQYQKNYNYAKDITWELAVGALKDLVTI